MLVAGFVGMSWQRFVAAVFAGRLIRFGGEAYLAVRLGEQALETLQQYYPLVGVVLGVGVVLYLVVKWLRRRRDHAATG
jgi:membrane protein DedA with SNARE-associated domain